jgi:hypothetical protein
MLQEEEEGHNYKLHPVSEIQTNSVAHSPQANYTD